MATMHTLRTAMPAPMTDERVTTAVAAAVAIERSGQTERIDKAFRAGFSTGQKFTRSRIPHSIAWLSGLVTGAVIALLIGGSL